MRSWPPTDPFVGSPKRWTRALARGARARGPPSTPCGSAPWRRAPWLLRRRPGVLLPTAGACAVLAASLASVPLFLSSAGTEAVALQAAERCPRDTGATYRIPPGPGSPLGTPDPFTPLTDDLGPSIQWGRIETSLDGPDPSRATDVVVLVREGALDHVDDWRARRSRARVWLSDRAMALTGAGPERRRDPRRRADARGRRLPGPGGRHHLEPVLVRPSARPPPARNGPRATATGRDR